MKTLDGKTYGQNSRDTSYFHSLFYQRMSRKPSSVSFFMPVCADQGEFIEHAVFAGNMYGTSKAAVEAVRSKGEYFSQYFVSEFGIGQNSH
jgi:hypothetical protein